MSREDELARRNVRGMRPNGPMVKALLGNPSGRSTTMQFKNFTRAIANAAIRLHREAILAVAIAADKRADAAQAVVHDQQTVVKYEQERLDDYRLSAAQAESHANDAWRQADLELSQFPNRYN